MISRRTLLATAGTVATGAALVGGAVLTHTLDDVARAVGVEPHPEPDPADARIVRAAARDQAALLAAVEATAARHAGLALAPFEAIGREHLAAVGGRPGPPDVAAVAGTEAAAVTALAAAYARAATTRSEQATSAFSPELVRVLASMSAGLTQCSLAVRELR